MIQRVTSMKIEVRIGRTASSLIEAGNYFSVHPALQCEVLFASLQEALDIPGWVRKLEVELYRITEMIVPEELFAESALPEHYRHVDLRELLHLGADPQIDQLEGEWGIMALGTLWQDNLWHAPMIKHNPAWQPKDKELTYYPMCVETSGWLVALVDDQKTERLGKSFPAPPVVAV